MKGLQTTGVLRQYSLGRLRIKQKNVHSYTITNPYNCTFMNTNDGNVLKNGTFDNLVVK